jgi:hypothetical protein
MVLEKAHGRRRHRRRIVAAVTAGLVTIGLGSTALLGGFTTGPSMQNVKGFQVVDGTRRPNVTYVDLAEYIVQHQVLRHLTYGSADGGEFFFYGTQRQALRLEGKLHSSQLFGVITFKRLTESSWLHMKGGSEVRDGRTVP